MAISADRPRLSLDSQASAGNMNGFGRVRLYGARQAISTAVEEAIWTGTAAVYPFPTVATPIVVVTADATDIAGGAGARSVIVPGLDANWMPIVGTAETVGLAGAGISATVKDADGVELEYLRVNGGGVLEVGTSRGSNAKAISITAVGGVELAHIPAGDGVANQCVYTSSAVETVLIQGGGGMLQSNKTLELLNVWTLTNNVDPSVAPFGPLQIGQRARGIAGSVPIDVDFDGALPAVPPRTDIWATAQSDTTAGDLDFWLMLKCIPYHP